MSIQEYHFLPYETDKLLTILSKIAADTCDMSLSGILNEVRTRAPDILNEFKNFESEICEFCNDFNSDGVMKIKNIPTEPDSDVITLLFGELIGSVTKYEGEGDFLMKIARIPGADLSRPGYSNSLEFPPHTDLSYVAAPPEFMVLHGVEVAKNIQCMSTFSGLNRILEHLDESDLAILQQPLFKFDVPVHYSGESIENEAIFSNLKNEKKMIRFRCDTVSATNPVAHKTLERLRSVVSRVTVRKTFDTGDMYLIANWRTLHGRTSLNPSARRVINRAYVQRKNKWNQKKSK